MQKVNQTISINITSGTIIKSILFLLVLWFLFVIKDLVLVLLTSVVIASAIEPGTKFLMKKKLPRVMSVLIIYIVVIVSVAVLLFLFFPPLIKDLSMFLDSLPSYIESLSIRASEFGQIPALQQALVNFSNNIGNTDFVSSFSNGFSTATIGFFTTASAIFGGVLSFVLIIVLSFYLSVQEDGVADFLRIIVPVEHESYVLDLWRRSQQKIGLWMQGQLLLGLLIGVLTYLGLSIFGIKNALLLAVVAAVFELIPVFGPILASVPAIIFGFMQGGATTGFLIIGLYVIIQQFESQLIHPLVVKKIIGIPAIIAIISLIIGAQIAGFLGILLSVPIAAVLMEYLYDVEKRKMAQLKEQSA